MTRRARSSRGSLALLGAVLYLAAPAVATASSMEVASQAMVLQSEGKHAEAVELLQRARRTGDFNTSRRDVVVLSYALGQVYSGQAARVPAEQAALLTRAVQEYGIGLKADRSDAATTSALARVFQRMGRGDDADTLLARWLRTTPGDGATVIALQLGDLRRDRKQAEAARAAYRIARAFAPLSETPWRRLTDSMADDAKTLWTWTDSLVLAYPRLVDDGYRSFLTRYPSDANAEAAFLRWVGFAADQGRPGDPLPAELAVFQQPRAELVAFIAKPSTPPTWWTQSRTRRDALARVCLAAGRSASRTSADWAERYWRSALNFAPHYMEIAQGGSSAAPVVFARLEILTELAALYDREDLGGPQGQRLSEIVAEMFQSKGEAYARGDLDAIQRHHTVLGMIYARHQVWTSPGYAQNAIFQYEHALTAAQRRESAVGIQPLPELKSSLADGYQSVGNAPKAMETRLLASQGYLDTDQVGAAEDELNKLSQSFPEAPASVRSASASLKQVATTRGRLNELMRADTARARAGLREVEKAQPEWLAKGKAPGLSDEFVARQRFKAYSDMSTLSANGGDRERAANYAVQAVGEIKRSPPVGAADAVRIRRIETQTRTDLTRDPNHLHKPPPRPGVGANPFDYKPPGTIKSLGVVGSQLPTEVRLNATIQEDKRLSDVKPTVQVTNTEVVVSVQDSLAANPAVKDYVRKKLRGVADGRKITVVARPASP